MAASSSCCIAPAAILPAPLAAPRPSQSSLRGLWSPTTTLLHPITERPTRRVYATPIRAMQGADARAARAAPAIDPGFGGLVLVDHYARLGVSRLASTAEIFSEYSKKCQAVRADTSLDEETSQQRLRGLEESLEVLATEESRRLYDWRLMRKSTPTPEVYIWPYEADITQSVRRQGEPRQMVPEDTEGLQKLGYFFLGWFILSAVLSLTLK